MSENDQDHASKCDAVNSETPAALTASDFTVSITPSGIAALEAWERARGLRQYDDGAGFVAVQCEEDGGV